MYIRIAYIRGMKDEKRIIRTYKVKPSVYKKAMRQAKKDGAKVSNLIEDALLSYSRGFGFNTDQEFTKRELYRQGIDVS
jgi:uncharacterized protein (DUF2461 family)